jgi:hypothetical protein
MSTKSWWWKVAMFGWKMRTDYTPLVNSTPTRSLSASSTSVGHPEGELTSCRPFSMLAYMTVLEHVLSCRPSLSVAAPSTFESSQGEYFPLQPLDRQPAPTF